MTPELLTFMQTAGEGLLALVLGGLSGLGVANKKLQRMTAPQLDPAYVASVDARISEIARDVVTRSHDAKNKFQAYELQNNDRDVRMGRLTERVDRAVVDIKENRSELLMELRGIKEIIETRFRDMGDKMDRITPRARRVEDSDD